jgi:hypothetical protein
LRAAAAFLGSVSSSTPSLELGFGLGLVHFLRQREAARHLAERALGLQHALVLGHFLLALHFRGQGDLGAVDGDLDVVLLHPGQLGGDGVGAVLLGDVHLHARQRCAVAVVRHGAHQKAFEQIIDQLVERIESGECLPCCFSFSESVPEK